MQPSAVQSKWYGETNKAIGGIFKLARRLSQGESACVIFIGGCITAIAKFHMAPLEVSSWSCTHTVPTKYVYIAGPLTKHMAAW